MNREVSRYHSYTRTVYVCHSEDSRVFSFMRGNILVITLNQALSRFFRSMVMPYASLYVLALGGSPPRSA
jgi:hypothetical protein